MKGTSAPPRGKILRSAVVGAAVAGIGVKKAAQLGKRPFLSEERRAESDRASDEDAARILFDALCVLKGCALKAAQLAAFETDLLPKAYCDALAKSCNQVSPMNRALAGKVIRRELGPPENFFQSFAWTPFAAASLGQVHEAVDMGGRSLAVKLQYPGVAEGVVSDIALLKGILAHTRYHRVFLNCFAAVRTKIAQELDYENEAAETAFFAEQIQDGPFVIPTVAQAHSTKRVLCTTRVEGVHLSEWLKTRPSQVARNHFGQLLMDFFNQSTFSLRRIHADPNPGNFLFREDGKLGIIDFGCIAALTPAFVTTISRLLTPDSPLHTTVEEQLHRGIGIHFQEVTEPAAFAAFLKEWGTWLREPYQTDVYDFSQNTDYFERGRRFANVFYKYIHHYDGDFIYYGRTLHGLFRMLHQLGAQVRMTSQMV